MYKQSILLMVFGVMSCNTPEIPAITQYLSVIDDCTDPQALQPAAAPIVQSLHFNEDKNKEVYFRLRTVSDKQLSPILEFHLPKSSVAGKQNLLDDPQYRDKSILAFYDTVNHAIEATNESNKVCEYSECFRTIADELTVVRQKRATAATVLVYSDLNEKSALFNVYDGAAKRLLHHQPESIRHLLESTHLLPDELKGVTVYLLYKPITREQDQQFQDMIQVYKAMLEARHATVIAQASNDFTYK